MQEKFAKPAIGAIIERIIDGKKHIIIQERWKQNGDETNGQYELPAGKIREYENVYDTVRREVLEETGLKVTKIIEEEEKVYSKDTETISFIPFCITQNLENAYSIICNHFICEAEGEPVSETDESRNIRWIEIHELAKLLKDNKSKFFIMNVNALEKYLKLNNLYMASSQY